MPDTDWRQTVARLRSVRARATLGATLVVAAVMIVGALGFSHLLSTSMRDAVDRAGEVRAEELAARIEAEGPSAVSTREDEIVQLLSPDGDIIAASEDAAGLGAASADESRVVTIDDEPVLLVSEELDDDRILVVGVSMEDDVETLGTAAALLTVAVPAVILLVAGTTWVVVGRALRPVARIREKVDVISADRLSERVPVPSSGDEIAALATTMNGMLDRLDDAARAQRRFVSDASHELRSPLATIRQYAELADAHPETTSVTELAQVVREEGLRLQGLVDALLLLARLDEGDDGRRESVDLDDVALAEAARLRGIGMDVDSSGIGPARVSADPRLIGQLARNLVDNAARHARGRIAVSVTQRGNVAVLVVEDDGEGIAPEERDRVFERFVRLDDARARDAGGSGLGLSIVRGVAEAAHGSVTVDDSRWAGARFTVTLPAAS
ncbi:HAMP domain-containing sensor histidine kinase [Microbacterium sp. cx-59]|uniref:sensor histidine kinase n=1 Tax=Microbacterium sp. cx-59 TaxID=2891207 RepID=UPI001E61D93C|nr:HAMP domain-containing sensor histidine kinase [Microbacterium sp. cx-59]MCC4908770.1 HAMP domain-containing histidine kinase [Microbacterium sp. cx-59]